MQKLLGDILVEKGYLTSADLNRALLFQMRKILGPADGITAAESFLLEIARRKYNARDEFYLGKILTELNLLPEMRIREALQIQQTNPLRKPRGRLDALLQITARINGSYNLIDVLNQVLVFACELTEAESSSLIVHDHANDSLVILMPTGKKADAVRELTIPRGKGIAGYVYERSTAVISNDVPNDHRFYREIDAASGYSSRQILCVPLIVKDKKLGAIEVINKTGPGTGFTNADRLLLELFSAHAAIAIENTRLTLALARVDDGKTAPRAHDTAAGGSAAGGSSVGSASGARVAAQLCASFLHALQKTFIPLRGYGERLREVSRDERVQKYRSYIDSEMARLIHRSELTLRFLKGELPFAPQEIEMGELLRELRSRTWVDCRLSGIAFEIETHGDLALSGDRELLLSGLECVFQNSRDAMPEGGVFSIEARHSGASGIVLRIRDTGRGFTADPLHQVFEPFFTQGKPNAAGLGLSIARWIIEAHGGTITAETRPGERGASLTVTLPSA